RYAGTADHPLESIIRSSQQRLANGNTLITESDGGRLLEVSAAGDIVWEYVNPVRAGDADVLIPIVSSAQRISPEALEPEFRQLLEAEDRSAS
ncbi:MAG: arylsulfotransferase family protein, partial [Pseudomonadota bacterium]|nr:arylsulfotransferase family protein [Pseudomonadota bacterium]